jgi:hypothetical protein
MREDKDARVDIPLAEEIADQDVVLTNFPALKGSWCIIDGLTIQIEKSGDESTQNAYYNGWLHDHLVSVFLFLFL